MSGVIPTLPQFVEFVGFLAAGDKFAPAVMSTFTASTFPCAAAICKGHKPVSEW